jgi:hypothetical protein
MLGDRISGVKNHFRQNRQYRIDAESGQLKRIVHGFHSPCGQVNMDKLRQNLSGSHQPSAFSTRFAA